MFAAAGLSVARIGILGALYPAVWGPGQLLTGALSNRVGRKPLIVAGMGLRAIAQAGFAVAGSFSGWVAARSVLYYHPLPGSGTAVLAACGTSALGEGSPSITRAVRPARAGKVCAGYTPCRDPSHSRPQVQGFTVRHDVAAIPFQEFSRFTGR